MNTFGAKIAEKEGHFRLSFLNITLAEIELHLIKNRCVTSISLSSFEPSSEKSRKNDQC